jgi:hypothetical protein
MFEDESPAWVEGGELMKRWIAAGGCEGLSGRGGLRADCDASGVDEGLTGERVSDWLSNLEWPGLDGIEDGGSGNRDNPRLIVLSAIPDALVSMDAADTWRG